jgi:hypothetical protein
MTPSDARQRVLDVAEELFMRRGYHSITITSLKEKSSCLSLLPRVPLNATGKAWRQR